MRASTFPRGVWSPVIGLEVHIQLKTRTKAFCRCATDFAAPPNSLVCPVCLGYPGALPVLNREMVRHAVTLGLATRSTIHRETHFARKNYFYPDLPKGYQITQHDTPLCTDGQILLDHTGLQSVRLQRIHLEEDAGKSFHQEQRTLVDFNRCGVPLLEMVTYPELKSSIEAAKFLARVRQLVRYLGISDGDMEKGSLRCDANISLRTADLEIPSYRIEIKNLNSIRGVRRALDFEIARQSELLDHHQMLENETRGWDESQRITHLMRTKESISDYRYFPEPDLPPLVLAAEWIESIRTELPVLPMERENRYINELKLEDSVAEVLVAERDISDYFEAVVIAGRGKLQPSLAAHWINGEVRAVLNRLHLSIPEFPIAPEQLCDLLKALELNRISSSGARKVFEKLLDQKGTVDQLVEQVESSGMDDRDSATRVAQSVLRDFPEEVMKYRDGRTRLLGFFVGEVLKRSERPFNPKMVSEVLKNLLQA